MRLAIVCVALIACCRVQTVASSAPEKHPSDAELQDAAGELADVCLGITDTTADEVSQILTLLKECRDVGIPAAESPASCGHYACNRIRMYKLWDTCPPRERHPQWMSETKL